MAENTTIGVIGLGGVGGIVARYVAVFLASLNRRLRLLLIDGDAFEPANATRMLFSRAGNKAVVLRDELLERLGESLLTVIAVEQYVTPQNIGSLIAPSSIVLLAVDNHATRKLLSDHAATLSDICLISAGNDGVGPDSSRHLRSGTFGNCQVYLRKDGQELTPPLTRFHPEIAAPADHSAAEKSCTELIVSTPQILFANLTAAACCLNTLLLHLSGELRYCELCFDVAEGRMSPVSLPCRLPAISQMIHPSDIRGDLPAGRA
jgi:hypothetical protein